MAMYAAGAAAKASRDTAARQELATGAGGASWLREWQQPRDTDGCGKRDAATAASRGHRGQLAVVLHYPAHDAAHPTVSEEDDVRSTPIVSLDAAASIRCIVVRLFEEERRVEVEDEMERGRRSVSRGASYWGFTSLDSGGRVTEAFATISDPKKERTYQLRKHGCFTNLNILIILIYKFNVLLFYTFSVDSQPTMEETIIVGDDLMMGPPSPIIPPEIASHVLEGVDLCDQVLRNFFLCLQINDVEPFCQDEIILYQECAAKRDKELRRKLFDSERKLGLSMPLGDAKERAANLEAQIKTLERRMILASGVEGMEGFRQRWSLHGRIEDTKRRMESLKEGITKSKSENIPEPKVDPAKKKWFF
ncbi:hypothetical protein ZIOFF_059186 [Zingiber officinale]|uniref:DUF7803 domain-containing protein n=1 Tax=Zingiber officinale TaxID=94328 RepID=A0A8J5KJZ4_ZINOF|nr:hypothetical protein ZIOFF_059186 [Zingiber officinale]